MVSSAFIDPFRCHNRFGFASQQTFSATQPPHLATVPAPETSCHKELFTVLFDPPSFIMVSSILRHLWKLSKLEKKFLPLPPIDISLPEPSIQPLNASIPEFINTVKPHIEGCAIKIGEIACSLVTFAISSTFIEYSSEFIKKLNDPVTNMISSCYGFVSNTVFIGGQE
ncbi:hypothetical protein L195_g003751 [Trifolium pratense]|uniref:Uncharacterized protein n=1 Tax=Trifolium pratense TaxID=57577 RepID=A0A2K3NW73_TRIPR|nr:hypothetical protein L195_g003751 [Trifolium pratense]